MNLLSRNIVSLSSEALEEEDQYLRHCFIKNTSYHSKKIGLLYFNNERYYQFVIARHLLKKLNNRISVETGFIDIVVFSNQKPAQYEIAIEMKRWMSSTGNGEIGGIQKDFDNLKKTQANNKLMLILSSNPKQQSIYRNIITLSRKINRSIDPARWYYKSFPTFGFNEEDNLFWVAGFEV